MTRSPPRRLPTKMNDYSNCDFNAIAVALAPLKTILVTSHLRPDGDALGSAIALALWLKAEGKNVTVWNEEGVLEKFRYLPESDIVTVPPAQPQAFEAVVALDTSVRNRLGTVLDAISSFGVFINVDHHVSNEAFGDLNLIDPKSPATGQIVYDFLASRGANITPAIAANLFAAISTDTGSFQYSGTTPHTFDVAAALVRAGVDVASLSRSMYECMPRRRLNLLRFALNDAEFICEDRAVSFRLPLAEVRRLNLLPEDNEGIIDHLRAVDGVRVAVFFEELPEGKVRVSARSKDPAIDVCQICGLFGGGGHPLAAGARIQGGLEEVREKFMKEVCDAIGRAAA